MGENQIITQVRQAMELGQAAGTADAALAALFRRAVTAGKRARTEVSIDRGVPSMGTRCREILAQELGGLRDKRILCLLYTSHVVKVASRCSAIIIQPLPS